MPPRHRWHTARTRTHTSGYQHMSPTPALRAVRRRLRALRLARQINRPINWKALQIVVQWERQLERVPPDQRASIFEGMRGVLGQIQQLHHVLKAANIDARTRASLISHVVKQPFATWMDTVVDIARDWQPR